MCGGGGGGGGGREIKELKRWQKKKLVLEHFVDFIKKNVRLKTAHKIH